MFSMAKEIKYECFVKYSGKQDWDRPFLSMHDLSRKQSDIYASKTLEFRRFNPSSLKIAYLQDGKINIKDENLLRRDEAIVLPESIDQIDAFLDIEGISIGDWRVFQSLIIPEYPRKKRDEIWIAYAGRDTIEIYNPLGPRKINEIELRKAIPVGEIIPIKMASNTGIRQKLLEKMPNLLEKIKRQSPPEELNAALHVRLDIDGNYVNLINGNYS